MTPADVDPIELAQTILGPNQVVRAEYTRAGDARNWNRYKPMAELHEHELTAYRWLMERMLRAITLYLETHVVHGSLSKADSRHSDWVLISPEHLEALREIIGDYHEAYIAGLLSPSLLRPGEVDRLINAGILSQDLHYVAQPAPGELPPESRESLADAYRYGRRLATQSPREQEHARGKQTYEETRAQPKPQLSRTEREAVHWAEEHAAEYVRGLSKRIAADLTSQVVETATKHARELPREERPQALSEELDVGHSSLTAEDIQDTVVQNLQKQEAWRKIVTNLGDKSGDWSRDLGRIAATEKTRALQEGFTRELSKKKNPNKVRVAKLPAPDACKHCVSLHLTGGPGTPPRIFTLQELIDNGSNVGRKAKDWLAVVGPIHPWCQCVLVHVPEGWVFDDSGQMVPELLTRAERLTRDLRKSALAWAERSANYSETSPASGVAIVIGDPEMRAAVEKVVARTPQQVFSKLTGVTLITTDTDREGAHLVQGDFAYWSGNEIRLQQTLPVKKVPRVLEHEIGHALNVHLFHALRGGVDAVYRWHEELWRVSEREGFVSLYAQKAPIENAAEVTRWFLYYRKKLLVSFPKQFTFLHQAYRGLL